MTEEDFWRKQQLHLLVVSVSSLVACVVGDVLLFLVDLLQLHQLLHAQRQLLLQVDEVFEHLPAAFHGHTTASQHSY